MLHFIFLKFERLTGNTAQYRRISDSGIDVRLLPLLDTRYV